jgi:hypothetical protein
MRGQAGFFDLDERLKELSAKGDHLERLSAIVDFEVFRPNLARAVPRSDGSKGGRPAFDLVFMFKVLILQASHSLSDERTEFLIKDRLSFMRFLRLGLADPVPDANTIWTFREALTRAQLGGNQPSRSCSAPTRPRSRGQAFWLWAVRSSTLLSWRLPSSATLMRRRGRSKRDVSLKPGATSLPSSPRRTGMPAGP